MSEFVNGVRYKTPAEIGEEYGYSAAYMQQLARTYEEGDVQLGLKAVKKRNRWYIDTEDAARKLSKPE